jgi:hypothetical protein
MKVVNRFIPRPSGIPTENPNYNTDSLGAVLVRRAGVPIKNHLSGYFHSLVRGKGWYVVALGRELPRALRATLALLKPFVRIPHIDPNRHATPDVPNCLEGYNLIMRLLSSSPIHQYQFRAEGFKKVRQIRKEHHAARVAATADQIAAGLSNMLVTFFSPVAAFAIPTGMKMGHKELKRKELKRRRS